MILISVGAVSRFLADIFRYSSPKMHYYLFLLLTGNRKKKWDTKGCYLNELIKSVLTFFWGGLIMLHVISSLLGVGRPVSKHWEARLTCKSSAKPAGSQKLSLEIMVNVLKLYLKVNLVQNVAQTSHWGCLRGVISTAFVKKMNVDKVNQIHRATSAQN